MSIRNPKEPEAEWIAEQVGISPEQVVEVVTRVLKVLHERSKRGEILVHTVCDYGGEALYHLGGILYHELDQCEDQQNMLVESIRLLAPDLIERYSTERLP